MASQTLIEINNYLDYVELAFTVAVEAFVLTKLRFKMDTSEYVIAGCYLLVDMTRVL